MRVALALVVLAVTASTGLAARVVCYYTNWSRFGNTQFKIEDIDAKLCSHVVYTFMGLGNDGSIQSIDPWNDFGDAWTQGGLKRFLNLRTVNPEVKLLVGVGGWNEGPLRFQSIVRNPEKRKVFLESTLAFIKTHNLDGLEIDWIFQGSGGSAEDRNGLTALLQEMRPRYNQNRYLLTLSTSGNPVIFETSYDVPALSKNLDFINVMAYDIHGFWDGKTGHVAPLHGMKDETAQEAWMNVETIINTYISKGAPPEKLNLDVVGYGRTFTLLDPSKTGPKSLTKGAGQIEPLPYRVFCVDDKKGIWKKFRIEEQKVPYAVAGDQWVGYEDVRSLKDKALFTKSKKLGGISFWSLDMDDFKGACGSGKYPLLRTIKEELNTA